MKEPIYYSREGESEEFLDVLPKKLTVSPILPHFYKDQWSRPDVTIFQEVNIKPYEPTKEDGDFIGLPKWDKPTTYEEVFDYLKKAIYRVWDSEKFHLIGHSSGYDSRLINKAIRELTDENGVEWGGRVFYVENMGEKPFKDILEHLNLDGVAYNYDIPPGWYHEYAMKFDQFYQKNNGVFAFPFNQWYDSFKDIHEQGLIPKDNIQGFTGYGAGEIMRKALRMRKGFAWYFAYLYRFQLYLFRHWGGPRWEHPFWDYDVMKALEALPQTYSCQRVAIPMCKHIVHELNHIPDWQTKHLRRNGYRTVAPELLKNMDNDYKQSWFGQRHPVEYNPDMNYTLWWFCYNAASLCEHLIKNDYAITDAKM